jgi:hypothetical protein
MMRSIAIAWAAVLLPGMAMSAPVDVGQATLAEQGTGIALVQGAAAVTETLRGIVDSVDQGNDTIRIRLSQTATEQFKVQDGLIFNAVRFGDPVRVSVQNISGFRTIVGLSKE